MKVLFDSNVYIKSWHDQEFTRWYETFARDLRPQTYASAVVVGECWAGARDKVGRQLVLQVFVPFERTGRIVIPLYSDWKEAGQLIPKLFDLSPTLRSKLGSLWNDLLIVLSSLRIGATVYTFNRQDFELIRTVKSFSLVVL